MDGRSGGRVARQSGGVGNVARRYQHALAEDWRTSSQPPVPAAPSLVPTMCRDAVRRESRYRCYSPTLNSGILQVQGPSPHADEGKEEQIEEVGVKAKTPCGILSLSKISWPGVVKYILYNSPHGRIPSCPTNMHTLVLFPCSFLLAGLSVRDKPRRKSPACPSPIR